MFNNIFSKFRLISLIEGISFLVLLFVAMPLKYLAGIPLAVKIVGMTHGILFILFVIALYLASKEYVWNKGMTIKLFIYSVIPFGFIPIEKAIMKNQPKD